MDLFTQFQAEKKNISNLLGKTTPKLTAYKFNEYKATSQSCHSKLYYRFLTPGSITFCAENQPPLLHKELNFHILGTIRTISNYLWNESHFTRHSFPELV